MTPAPPAVPLVMRGRLGELGECWLHLRCGCGRGCAIPQGLLAQRHGTGTPIGAILPRLKCKQCGQAPAEARLAERPDAGAHGGAIGGWIIPLISAPENLTA